MANFCPHCGKPLKESIAFCPYCGARLPVKTQQKETPREQPGFKTADPVPCKKKKGGALIGIAGILLVAAFGITAFVYPGFLMNGAGDRPPVSEDKDDTDRPTAKPAVTESAVSGDKVSDDAAVPKAVTDPKLTGTWGFHDKKNDVDMVWTFHADGTGSLYSNGYEMPIASYVASGKAFTQYPEDGLLLTVYWGEITETIGGAAHTITMDPIEYGYQIDGKTLRITYSRDIANDYIDFTRE